MTTILNLTRTRGDTFPIKLTINNPDGTPMDLFGKQCLMTVNSEEDPTDTSTQLFQIVGTVTDAAAGKVEFTPSLAQADNVGRFFYDIEVRDELQVWTWSATSGTADSLYPLDGSLGILMGKRHVNDTAVYQSRDGTSVVRFKLDEADSGALRQITLTDFPVIDSTRNFKVSGEFYMDETWWAGIVLDYQGTTTLFALVYIFNDSFDKGTAFGGTWLNSSWVIQGIPWVSDGLGQPFVAGWIRFAAEFNIDGTMKAKAWQPPADEPESWHVTVSGEPYPTGFSPPKLTLQIDPIGDADYIDIAWLKLEMDV